MTRMERIPTVRIGGLPIARLGLEETARVMVAAAKARTRGSPPLYFTSANGEVLARCRSDRAFCDAVMAADVISADGQPLVFCSRLVGERLNGRVATTDLFPRAAREAEAKGASFYVFGGTEDVNRRVWEVTRRDYPELRLAGRQHGYVEGRDLEAAVEAIDDAAPDVLWVALGVPKEQEFVRRWSARLTRVGAIKTSGGLFDFVSMAKPRAPRWMQDVGLEWAFRLAVEPRRLWRRYAVTSPIAVLQLATRSG
jgi:exopolysaccharide biosynthesis WecB/TagA/CpsF family protein